MLPRLRLLARSGYALSIGLALAGCGSDGAEPASKTASDVRKPSEKRREGQIQASSEIGGLNEEQVDAAFSGALGSLQKCLDRGAERVEFLGGSVSFFVKIDSSGGVEHVHLEHSTLGDRKTEKCMMLALKKREWPKPVGGEVGLARKSFDFDPPNDVRPPTDWDPEQATKALDKLETDIGECKSGASGNFEATAYVSTDGSVLAASVTPPDEDGEGAVDCLVQALESASFPSPGSWPAKVSFTL